jgi:peptidoglycan/xylan/chitin deacetylase (PgdA/CDA1 family)
MYHDVFPSTTSSGGGSERFAVPLASFEAMLDAIKAFGRTGCSLEKALQVEARRVAISFDDGTRSQLDHAVPALIERGMTATFFVTTDWVGSPGFMTWPELRQIASCGMSVQSHTRSHPFLSELRDADVRSELAGSKAALDHELGQDTTQISLPGGDNPRRHLRHLFEECGYRVVAGSRWGINREPGTRAPHSPLRRCDMRGEISIAEARRVLEGNPWISFAVSTKEASLNTIRTTLGATRYARWRRRFLDFL